jgi:flagella basal body P-ring formation protein FlgA
MRRLLLALALGVAAPLASQAGERVLVPSRVIYPGEVVTAQALQELVLIEGRSAPASVAFRKEDLEGKVAKRTLLPGRYVGRNALREAWLVDKGATVEMVFSANGLTISAQAVSLESGSEGDTVKLRNRDSGKIVSGTIMADGSVRVAVR